MKRTHYAGVIHKDPDSDYGISFPDFPGCISAGDTIEEVITMGTEALSGHIAAMAEDGDELPDPTALENLGPADLDGSIALVVIPATLPGKAKRINITLDENLIKEIDKVDSNRSGFLAGAARAELSRRVAA